MPPAIGVLARRAGAPAPARQAPAPRPARQAPLRVVGSAPRRARRRLLRLGALLLLTASLLAVVFGHAMLAQEQIKLSTAQSTLSAAQALHRQLLLSVAEAETPSRIVAAAEALHMVQPTHVQQLPSVPLSTPTTTAPATTADPTAPANAGGRTTAAATR
jgi:hypothetical protein